MPTVWKINLQASEVQDIRVPTGAELLCAREQFGEICIWFRCDPDLPGEKRVIAVCPTGGPAPREGEGRYLGTAFLAGGRLVYHVFERVTPQ